jgi:glycosyltransferase involved in cell wall biosynthesis
VQLKASIIIPAHNSAQRIAIPLRALLAQDAPDGSFEVVVIDNASTDETAQVAATHPAIAGLARKGVECRVVREEKLGLAFARIRGIHEARAELVCFLDDDTAPEPAYVSEAIKAFSDPATGLLVSRIYPFYETEPPPSIARREHLLAINNKLGDAVIEWEPTPTLAPTIGAGMWVRREVFLSAVPWNQPGNTWSDRKGNSLVSGGDIEIGFYIGKAGYKRVYWPQLKLSHHIPKTRLNAKYICRLINGIVRSQIALEAKYARQPYNLKSRFLAIMRLLMAVMACPVLFLRKDGLRETLFVLASRWARIRGPYHDPSLRAS